MSENKLRNRAVIDAELQKTKAELAIAQHRQAKLRNQIKGMTEKERRHRNIVWGSHFEYLIEYYPPWEPPVSRLRATWKFPP